ncbi:aldose epimerase family protein [Oryzobacter sp. R7]|uniref:aldose epimerase family protein n=1 Tax=Oryzobacter faecalis TaxID=3388656 RepID=UPI00398CFF89
MTVSEVVGRLPDGSPVHAHTIGGADRPQLRVLDLGATVASLHAFDPDPHGERPNLVLGHRDVGGYLRTPTPYLGATVGRFANRIAGARFELAGVVHRLAPNEGDTCLHGGPGGFHSRVWTVTDLGPDRITLELVSEDGDQGFPGELTASVTYTVTGAAVHVDLRATTTATTVVNLTNHTYWNLAGEGSGSVDGHRLTVDAAHYLPVDSQGIPLDGAEPVDGTPLDLRRGEALGACARRSHPQTEAVRGIDHCLVLDGGGLRRAARLEEPRSGRHLEVHTDQPGLQVYTGNHLDGTVLGTSGRWYRQGDGVALETQNPPDAPNRSWARSAVLDPGSEYLSRTQWRLGQDPPSVEEGP